MEYSWLDLVIEWRLWVKVRRVIPRFLLVRWMCHLLRLGEQWKKSRNLVRGWWDRADEFSLWHVELKVSVRYLSKDVWWSGGSNGWALYENRGLGAVGHLCRAWNYGCGWDWQGVCRMRWKESFISQDSGINGRLDQETPTQQCGQPQRGPGTEKGHAGRAFASKISHLAFLPCGHSYSLLCLQTSFLPGSLANGRTWGRVVGCINTSTAAESTHFG